MKEIPHKCNRCSKQLRKRGKTNGNSERKNKKIKGKTYVWNYKRISFGWKYEEEMRPRKHPFGWICTACNTRGYVFKEEAELCCTDRRYKYEVQTDLSSVKTENTRGE